MATMYISPSGMGDKSGSSMANAAPISGLNGMIKKAGPGGTVALIADKGEYNVSGSLTINQAGAAGAPVTIKGVSSSGAEMNAVFNGTRAVNYTANAAGGNELFKLMGGASNLSFDNITTNNIGSVFRVGGNINNLKISDVKADNVGTFFQTYASGSATDATVNGLVIQNVDIDGYSKAAIRVGYNSSNVLIDHVHGDSERQGDGSDFAIGVHITGTAHDITVSNSVMENAQMAAGSGYWNGDGFATERGTYDIRFVDTVARGNADGGYDLKSASTTLTRALAEDNGRNFRVWGEATMIDSVALDPHVQGGSSSQVQVWVADGGTLAIKGGVISDSGSKTRVFDNSGTVTVDGTAITLATGAILNAAKAPAGLVGEAINHVLTTGLFSHGTVWTMPLAVVLKQVASAATIPAATPPAAILDKSALATNDKAADASIRPVQKSSAAADTLKGTDERDLFDFTAVAKNGADTILSFAKDDLIVLKAALPDGNKDGLITFGKNGLLNHATGTIKAADLDGGVRALGKTAEGGFIYGEASTRLKTMVEGALNADNIMTGDQGDKKANRFLFDTDLGMNMGNDTIRQFGARDVVVTTSLLGSSDVVGSKVTATGGRFDLVDGSQDIGTLAIATIKGATANVLEYDGSRTVDGVTYHVYSLEGSVTDLGFLI